MIALPRTSLNGDVYLVVEIDATNNIIETNENQPAAGNDGNVFVSPTPSVIPAQLGLSFADSTVIEGGAALQGTVTRNGNTAQPLVVTLSPSVAGQATLPAAITIPAGQTSARFDLQGVPDGLLDGVVPVQISASAPGFGGAAATIDVVDADRGTLTLTTQVASVAEGSSAVVTIRRSGTTIGDLLVTLASSAGTQLSLPAGVLIPAGQESVQFSVTAPNDLLSEKNESVTVTATATGYDATTLALQVIDNDVPVISLAVDRTSIGEGDFNHPIVGTVTRQTVTAVPVKVKLTTSDASGAVVPAEVIIPAGQASVTFFVTPVDDALLDGTQTVTIGAYGKYDACGCTITTGFGLANIDVLDDESPALSVSVDNEVVREGQTPAGTLTIRRNNETTLPLVVTLASSDASRLIVPPSVVIPAGQSSATVNFTTVNDGQPSGEGSVVVSASAAGLSSGSRTLVVTDINRPDLVISQLGSPTTGLTNESASISWTTSNSGLATATDSWIDRIYISKDAVVGNDVLAGQFSFSGPVSAGQSYSRNVPVTLPSVPGTYWLIVETDASRTVNENSETNNFRVSATSIEVAPGYSATVMTDVEMAPADTPVLLIGSATRPNGSPAAFQQISVHILVRGTKRILTATTDATGQYRTTFTPLPGEGGSYTVGAAHPSVVDAPVQDAFKLVGMRAEPPADAVNVLEAGPPLDKSLTVRNLADVPLTGVTVTVLDVPANLQVTAEIAGGATTLPAMGTLALNYSVTALSSANPTATFRLRISSAEAPAIDVPVTAKVIPLVPVLTLDKTPLTAGMVRGQQRLVEFTVTNNGGAATGDLSVRLPNAPWLSLASPATIPSLAPGVSATLSLRLAPATNLALGNYTGTILVDNDRVGVTLPYQFTAVSTAVGSVAVEVVDEYSFYADGEPRVAGATVTLKNDDTGAIAAEGMTNAAGRLSFDNVTEGYYQLIVRAADHTNYRKTVFVEAGQTLSLQPFVAREVVKYFFDVVPTEIEDRTKVTITTEFDTNVPIPVVVVSPTYVDVNALNFVNGMATYDLTISNHGLIASEQVRLSLPTHPRYTFTPLISDIGTVPAGATLTIPITVVDNEHIPGASISGTVTSVDGSLDLSQIVIKAVNTTSNRVFAAEVSSDGTYAIFGLDVGDYEITAVNGAIPPMPRLSIIDSNATLTMELVVGRSLVLDGVVTDARDGVALPGATILLFSLGALIESAEADTFGRFQFQGLLPAEYELEISAPGYARAGQRVLLNSDDFAASVQVLPESTIDIDVDQLTTAAVAIATRANDDGGEDIYVGDVVAGRIHFGGLSAGNYAIRVNDGPTATLKVPSVDVAESTHINGGSYSLTHLATIRGHIDATGVDAERISEVGLFVGEALIAVAKLDDSGDFEFITDVVGELVLTITDDGADIHSDSRTISISPGDVIDDVVITVVQAHHIVVTLDDSQSSATIERLQVELLDGSQFAETTIFSNHAASFFVPHAGRYILRVPGTDITADIIVSPQDAVTLHTLVLPHSISIRGTLRYLDSSLETNGAVSLVADDHIVAIAHTNADGRFFFTSVAPGQYSLLAEFADGTAAPFQGLTVSVGQDYDVDFTSGSSQLEIVLQDYSPTETPATAYLTTQNGVVLREELRPDGSVSFSNLVAGQYRVDVYASNSRYATVDVELADTESLSEVISLQVGAAISGTIVLPSAIAATDVTVFLFDPHEERVLAFATPDDGGAFSFDHLPQGDYEVFATGTGIERTTPLSLHLIDNVTIVISSVQPATSFISGRLLDESLGALSSVEIQAYDASGRPLGSARSDAAGRFVVEIREASSVTIVAAIAGYLSAGVREIIPTGDVTQINEIVMIPVAIDAEEELAGQNASALTASQAQRNQITAGGPLGYSIFGPIIDFLYGLLGKPRKSDLHVDEVRSLPSPQDCYSDCESAHTVAEKALQQQDDAYERVSNTAKIIFADKRLRELELAKYAGTLARDILSVTNNLTALQSLGFTLLDFGLDLNGIVNNLLGASDLDETLATGPSAAATSYKYFSDTVTTLSALETDFQKEWQIYANQLPVQEFPRGKPPVSMWPANIQKLSNILSYVGLIKDLTFGLYDTINKLTNLASELRRERETLEKDYKDYESKAFNASFRNQVYENCLDRHNGDCDEQPCSANGAVTYVFSCAAGDIYRATTIGFAGLSDNCNNDLLPGGSGGSGDSRDDPIQTGPQQRGSEANCTPGVALASAIVSAFAKSETSNELASAAAEGVCAQVTVAIDQTAVQTRDAFDARLTIVNDTAASPITNLRVDLSIYDAEGRLSNDKFLIRQPIVVGAAAVDGTGRIDSEFQASASWIIIPSIEAAIDALTQYFVGGTIRYMQDGLSIVIELTPVGINVLPSPQLILNYFQERDVFADDPFTPEFEPSVPFSLGVIVTNDGGGAAKNLRIESAQPRITENEKGLDISFTIVGTKVNGVERSSGLTLTLGDIAAGQSIVGQWIFTAPLQGHFIKFDASFTHQESVSSGVDVSLIRAVNIFETVRTLNVGGAVADGLPDFLTDELPDANKLPDTLHLSDGSVASVAEASSIVTSGVVSATSLSVTLNLDAATVWTYARVADPGGNAYRIAHIVRADGTEVPAGQYWQTDRTFLEVGKRPIYENILHLVELDPQGPYTLIYVPRDAQPPTITSIQEVSPDPTIASVPFLDVQFSEPIAAASFGVEDVALSRDGIAVPLAAGVSIVQQDALTYRIAGLSSVTGTDGHYVLSIDATGVTDVLGNAGDGVAAEDWTRGEFHPAVAQFIGVSGPSVQGPVASVDLVFTVPLDLSTLGAADVQLTRDGGANLLPAQLAIIQVGDATYRIANLGTLTAPEGSYRLTIDARGVVSSQGLAGTSTFTLDWVHDSLAPTLLPIAALSPQSRKTPVAGIDLAFSEPIVEGSLTHSALTLTRNGQPVTLPAELAISRVDATHYHITGLSNANSLDGNYVLQVVADGVTDLAGNHASGNRTVQWTIDSVAPAPASNLNLSPLVASGISTTTLLQLSGHVGESGLAIEIFDGSRSDRLGAVQPAGSEFSVNLAALSPGAHTLRVRATDLAGNWAESTVPVFVNLVGPAVEVISGVPADFTAQPLSFFDVSFTRPIDAATLTAAAVSITRNGGPNLVLPAGLTIEPVVDGLTYRFSGLAAATGLEGRYELQLDLTGVKNDVGISSTEVRKLTWTNDHTAPTSVIRTLEFRQDLNSIIIDLVGDDPTLPGGIASSGIAAFDLFVSDNGSPFQYFETLPQTQPGDAPTTTFAGEPNHIYYFRSVARDVAGNVEAKGNRVDAWTYVPDLFAPQTQVDNVDTTDATFEVSFSGVDRGMGMRAFQLLVQVDDGAVQNVGTYSAGVAALDGTYTAMANYQAISDGSLHEYRFFTRGTDWEGTVEAEADPPSDLVVNARFAPPPELNVVDFDVQQGADQRSFIRYLDVFFNTSSQLAAIINSLGDGNSANDRIRLTRFGLDGSGPGTDVSLAGRVNALDRALALDFGADGLGGDRNGAAGDGYYRLAVDLDGDGSLESELAFFRLFGDADGDGDVDNNDLAAVTSALGQVGANLNGDLNGDGRVNALDRQAWQRGRGKTIAIGLQLDD